MNEQRTLPRWKIKKQVNVRIQEQEMFSNCVLEDINTRGMCVGLPKKLSQLRPVTLGLELADGTQIDLNVQVPWVQKMVGYYRHGLVFNETSDEDQQNIRRYVLNSITKS